MRGEAEAGGCCSSSSQQQQVAGLRLLVQPNGGRSVSNPACARCWWEGGWECVWNAARDALAWHPVSSAACSHAERERSLCSVRERGSCMLACNAAFAQESMSVLDALRMSGGHASRQRTSSVGVLRSTNNPRPQQHKEGSMYICSHVYILVWHVPSCAAATCAWHGEAGRRAPARGVPFCRAWASTAVVVVYICHHGPMLVRLCALRPRCVSTCVQRLFGIVGLLLGGADAVSGQWHTVPGPRHACMRTCHIILHNTASYRQPPAGPVGRRPRWTCRPDLQASM